MNRSWLPLAVLTALGIVQWTHDLSWWAQRREVLPILLCLPLTFWLGMPWTPRDTPKRAMPWWWVLLAPAGVLLHSATLLAAATAAGWITWADTWLQDRSRGRAIRLTPVMLMAFPFITLDWQALGWLYRYSGAWAASKVFSAVDLDVLHNGTEVLIEGVLLQVDASCAGLHTLQVMLALGMALAAVLAGESRYYWVNLPLLLALSWLANTARVIALAAVGLIWGVAAAESWLHEWGGLSVVFVMFLLSWPVIRWIGRMGRARP